METMKNENLYENPNEGDPRELALVIRNPRTLKDIETPGFDVCMAALMHDGLALEHVRSGGFTRRQYLALSETALKQNPAAFALVDRRAMNRKDFENLCFSIIEQDGLALRCMEDQSPELCLAAVEQNPNALPFVNKAMCEAIGPWCYPLLQKAALEKKKQQRAQNPGRRSKKKRMEKDGEDAPPPPDLLAKLEEQTEELCLAAVQQDGLQLRYVLKQTRKLCVAAFRQNPDAERYVRNRDWLVLDDVLFDIAEGFGNVTDTFAGMLFHFCRHTARKIPDTLKVRKKGFDRSAYYKNCLAAVTQNCCNLRFVKPGLLSLGQYKYLCLRALKEFPQAMEYMDKKPGEGTSMYFDIYREGIAQCGNGPGADSIFSRVDAALLSAGQYRDLCFTLLDHGGSLKICGAEILGREYYCEVCEKAAAKDAFQVRDVDARFLSREQYRELCLAAIRREPFQIEEVDRDCLDAEDYYRLCQAAVEKKGRIIYYLQCLDLALIDLAIAHGGGLKYLKKQDFDRCLAALSRNGAELKYVRPEQFSRAEYVELCKTALRGDANSLALADGAFLDDDQYRELCGLAMEEFPPVIRLIDEERIPAPQYHDWRAQALRHDGFCIKYIPWSEGYFDLAMTAVKSDGANLEYVKYLRLNPEQYREICEAAGRRNTERAGA